MSYTSYRVLLPPINIVQFFDKDDLDMGQLTGRGLRCRNGWEAYCRQALFLPLFRDSFHNGVGVTVVCLPAVASATRYRRKGDKVF